jgi:hypothetical protein
MKYENFYCVIAGKEEFAFTSPIFKQNIYAGVFDEFEDMMSPLDFFHINYKKYPLAKDAIIHTQVLGPGDCVYVPSNYWA